MLPLDSTFCTNKDCTNLRCKRRLSYSVVRAAEKVEKPYLSMADMKDTQYCEGYINESGQTSSV